MCVRDRFVCFYGSVKLQCESLPLTHLAATSVPDSERPIRFSDVIKALSSLHSPRLRRESEDTDGGI